MPDEVGLPTEVYVAWNDENDESFLEASGDINDFAELRETRIVGMYLFVKALKVQIKVTQEVITENV